MAWTSAGNRYKPNVSVPLLLARIYFISFYFSFCSSISFIASCSLLICGGVKFFRNKKRKSSRLKSSETERKTFSRLSANSPYCPDTCSLLLSAGAGTRKTRPIDINVGRETRNFYLFLRVFIKNISKLPNSAVWGPRWEWKEKISTKHVLMWKTQGKAASLRPDN